MLSVCWPRLIQRQQQLRSRVIHYHYHITIPTNPTNVALKPWVASKRGGCVQTFRSSLTPHEVQRTDSWTSFLHSTDVDMQKLYSCTPNQSPRLN